MYDRSANLSKAASSYDYFICPSALLLASSLRRTLLLNEFYSAFSQHPDVYREFCSVLSICEGFMVDCALLIAYYSFSCYFISGGANKMPPNNK